MVYDPYHARGHTSEAVVLMDGDSRFFDATIGFIKRELKITNFDLVAVAGAAKNLVDPTPQAIKSFVLKQIRIGVDCHSARKIFLFNHTDCGQYGGAGSFSTHSEEVAAHREDLLMAKKLLEQEFFAVNVECYFVDKAPGEIVIRKVIETQY